MNTKVKTVCVLFLILSISFACTDLYINEYNKTESIYYEGNLTEAKGRLIEFEYYLLKQKPIELSEKTNDVLSAILLTRIRLYSIGKLENNQKLAEEYFKKIDQIEEIRILRNPSIKKTSRPTLDKWVFELPQGDDAPAWIKELTRE